MTFRTLTPRDLAHYVASRRVGGRAGAYAIQGLGGSLVERIEGDYLNVVGLPARCSYGCSRRAWPGATASGDDARATLATVLLTVDLHELCISHVLEQPSAVSEQDRDDRDDDLVE